jgi:hypothetical protein
MVFCSQSSVTCVFSSVSSVRPRPSRYPHGQRTPAPRHGLTNIDMPHRWNTMPSILPCILGHTEEIPCARGWTTLYQVGGYRTRYVPGTDVPYHTGVGRYRTVSGTVPTMCCSNHPPNDKKDDHGSSTPSELSPSKHHPTTKTQQLQK